MENNCYLNVSLQLLTRIKELKEQILNFNDLYNDTITKGKLIKEFQNILNQIDNDLNNRSEIDPTKLKRIMGEIDHKYKENNQEDANQFISYFINEVFEETANKDNIELKIKKLEMDNEIEKKAYDNFYKKFYMKKGYSFILELFYGIMRIKKYCKNCDNIISIKFNAYNMLELPIYELAKQNKYKSLNFYEILKNYFSDIKSDYSVCKNCNKYEIYTNTSIYTLPKYLIIFFARVVDEEYINNNIEYPEILHSNRIIINNIKKQKYAIYKLDCVIEHYGNAYSGHYTALCPINMNNQYWYRFNDNFFDKYDNGYKSKNSVILLYKFIDNI